MKNGNVAGIQKTGLLMGIALVSVLIVLSNFPVSAQQLRNAQWELAIGVGVGGKPMYVGSDEIDIRPFPYVDFRYKIPRIEFFINNENGAGVNLKSDKISAFTVSFGINSGESRNTDEDDGDDLILLEETQEVTCDYQVFGLIEMSLLSGALFSKVSFLPIETDYEEINLLDEKYDGVLVNAGWRSQIPLDLKLTLDLKTGFTWMNGEYAEAFHSLLLPTSRLERFDADSGVRDINAYAAIIYMANARMGAKAYAAASYLVGDAGDSPFTVEELQPQAGLAFFYSF